MASPNVTLDQTIDSSIENPPYAGEKLLPFVRLVEFEALIPSPAETIIEEIVPISDYEIRVKNFNHALAAPIVNWSKLGAFLRASLSELVERNRLNVPELITKASKGEPLAKIPYLQGKSWSSQIIIIVDDSPEMWPFKDDVEHLVSQLKTEAGKYSVVTRRVETYPLISLLKGVASNAAVMVLSAMGRLSKDEKVSKSWDNFSTLLKKRGYASQVLCPVSPRRWQASAWNYAAWGRKQKLKRFKKSTKGQQTEEELERENQLKLEVLAWLEPCYLITRKLLREVRLLVAPSLDESCEYDLWHHCHCRQSGDSFHLKDEVQNSGLLSDLRQQLVTDSPHLVGKVQSLIETDHADYSSLHALDLALRFNSEGSNTIAFLEKVVSRLQELSENPQGSYHHSSGIPQWLIQMVERLPADMEKSQQVSELLARGLVFAHRYAREEEPIFPKWIDIKVVKQLMNKPSIEFKEVIEYELFLIAGLGEIQLSPFLATKFYPLNGISLGTCKALIGEVFLSKNDGAKKVAKVRNGRQRITVETDIARGNNLDKWLIETDRHKLTLEQMKRPSWASAMGYDIYGLWAEFKVDSIIFKLRWIPPGRFKMGSPESEEGRSEDEGPQQEVVITDGYWMASTQTTQEQWQVVMEKNPSHFKEEDKKKHPVESVSWDEVQDYLVELNTLVEGLELSLPSEAEWEYACRAKNESSYNQDEELKGLGWYGEGSKGKTHAVGQKLANNWGLYDMHGNVWEWCMDDKRDYSIEPIENPIGSMESAERLLRGGSFWGVAWSCRSAFRDWIHRDYRGQFFGFRLAARSGKQVSRTRSKVSGSEQ